MQVLWNQGILQGADYLAGVSGGSYAVTAATLLRTQSKDAFRGQDAPGPFALGSPELDYLRNRTNYLAPGWTGRWNLALRFVLGVAFNVCVVFAAVFVLGRLAGWMYGLAYPSLQDPGDEVTFGWLAWGSVLVPLGLGVLAQLVDLLFRPAGDRWWRLLVRWSGTLVAVAIVAGVVVIALPALLAWLRRISVEWAVADDEIGGRGASVLGALAVIAGSALNVLSQRGMSEVTSAAKKVPRKLLKLVGDLLVWVVGPLALLVTFLVGADATTNGWSTAELAWCAAILMLLGLLAWQGNPIAWSLQPFYKRRLRSVFCLQRVVEDNGTVWVRQIPQADEPRLSELHSTTVEWPELLICAAVNISDLGLSPPRFGVAGFVFSPTEIGGHVVGYIPTAEYERRIECLRWFQRSPSTKQLFPEGANAGVIRDVSPLSAVSISGAAISPSMGRMSRPAYRIMLTLLNLRLGVWLPNPRHVAAPDFDGKRRVKPRYLVKEMAGANRIGDPFLYVSDGGHYENLGLVELLRRGCTEIWCLDAAGDRPGQLRTLGQAEALARAELGVEFDTVDLDVFTAVDDQHPTLSKASHAVIGYRYADGRPGRLIYIRKALDRNAPTDLLTFQAANLVFPYDGTGDQFYDFEQFEAYRRLGVHTTATAVNDYRAAEHRPAGSSPEVGP